MEYELAAKAAETGPSITFDWTINIGNIITLLALLGGGVFWLISTHLDTKGLRKDVTNLQTKIDTLSEILTKLGRHEERFTNNEGRISRLEDMQDDLRRGEGFVLPLKPR